MVTGKYLLLDKYTQGGAMRNKLSTVILLIITLCTSFAFVKAEVGQETCDWTQFGGNVAGTRCVPAECGPESAKPVKLWEYKELKQGCQTPLISGDNAIVDEYAGSIICFNIKNGKLLWKSSIYKTSSRKCCDSERFYFFDGLQKLVCLNLKTGKELWSKSLDERAASQLVCYNNKLYYGSTENYLYCHSAEDGKILSTFKANDKVFGTPAIQENKIVFGTHLGITCVELKEDGRFGKHLWSNTDVGEGFFSAPVIFKGKVYSIAGRKYDLENSLVCSYNLTTGKLLWKTKIGLVDVGELAVHEKYVVAPSVDTKIYCLERETGNFKWEFKTSGKINCSPAIYGNNVIAGSDDGNFYCIDIESGKELWRQYTGTSFFDYAAIGKNKILLCGKSIICLGDEKDFMPNQTPARISLTPEISKTFVNKRIQFKAEVFDEFGKIIPNCPVEWKASANSNIDKNGLFYAEKVGKYVVACVAEEVRKELLIEVVSAYETTPKNFEFTNIEMTSKYHGLIKIKNNTDEDCNVKINPSSDVLIVNSKEIVLKSNIEAEINFDISTKALKKGQEISENIEIVYGDSEKITIPVKISVSESQENCIVATPSVIDFGYIERTKSKTISLSLSSPVPLKAKIVKIDDWFVASKNEFNLGDTPFSIEFTASTSKLPKGKDFAGEVVIETDQNWCKKLVVPVKLQTDEGVIISLTIDSKEAKINNSVVILDAPAQIIKGRTMVPLRFVAEAFGCNVDWNSAEGKATIQRGNVKIILVKGKNTAVVNGVEQKLDSPPVIIGGRTLVPLRFISEPFGARVNWDNKTKTITIVWEPN